jgi:hypothetical protein
MKAMLDNVMLKFNWGKIDRNIANGFEFVKASENLRK